MKAFIGRLMCCVIVVFAAPRLPVASVYGVSDVLDTGSCEEQLSDESESHNWIESPNGAQLDHVEENIAAEVAVSFSKFPLLARFLRMTKPRNAGYGTNASVCAV